MLTISSIVVSPWPQQTPAVKAVPLSVAKTSNTVSVEDSGVAFSAVSSDGPAVQTAYVPTTLPPVDPTKEAVGADLPTNVVAPEKAAESSPNENTAAVDRRFRGQLPPQQLSPNEIAMERQINELLPNLWQASRAAVDVLIGEEAKAAAAKAADISAQSLAAPEALESYTTPSTDKPVAGSVINTQA